ncbi:hypothetical protein [Paracoccus saliphilus]|uniref:Uncharacterized protein n=1 Tax=Paracoccus saliphilus TaxID=405559 RepID=A0AA46A7A2_9RHOB|nr:hypothetical protein [Paracoccus saliphilus]WCR04752.1 hypothetical protein JHX88_08575 [Paracoccus saliphilus]SIT10954.1 hypothetical protein SAMN05421772_11917 [Paracoccus saliphilus]
MKINFDNLENLIGKILEAHKSGEVSQDKATHTICHLIAAANLRNEQEFKSWTDDPATFERWLKMTKESYSYRNP